MKNVLEYLELSAKKYPDKTAVSDEKGEYTYSRLVDLGKRIGSALASIIGTGEGVGVFAEKSADVLSAFFGIVYAGGFYSMLNPSLPHERLKQIQSVLGARVIVTTRENYDLATELFAGSKIFVINDLQSADIDEKSLDEIRKRAVDTDPLYANFTSGSTGVPKGVLVSHRSVIDFIDVFTDLFSINSDDVIGNQAPFDFDVSVKDIYSCIKTGARLVIIPKFLFSSPAPLLDYICDNKITTMIWAVSALCLISTFHALDYKIPETVNKILFSGEVMPDKHLKSWMEHLPNTMFVNLYGPTEITCNCTYHIVDRNRTYENGLPIGKAFPNEDVFLLDGDNKKVTSCDTAGEICVRGTALALGYYNDPEQTAKAFVQNPLNPFYPELIYRTGDLGKYDENGDIFFCGRKDFQIKHMGHRIELEEIEKAMNAISGIERCCCVFDSEKSRLYGFFIGELDKKELHRRLQEHLPVFMIPGALRKVDSLPVTPNGKIDRKALLFSVKGKRNG